MILKLIILCLLYSINNAIFFCHSLCKFNDCNGVLSSDCISCPDGFQSPTTCTLDPIQRYIDIGMVNGFVGLNAPYMSISEPTIPTRPPFFCGGGQIFYGNYSTGEIVTVSILSPSLNYYKLRLTFSIITIDQWDITSKVKILFTDGTVNLLQYQSLQNDTISTRCEHKCQSGAPQCYKIVNYEFNYDSPVAGTILYFKISAQFNSQYNPWSLRQVYLLARKCHDNCKICFGHLADQCTQCVSGFQLSNTTCDLNCLEDYGSNSTIVCMKCQINCTNCTTRPRFCISCKLNHYLYTYGVDQLCLPQCPNGTYLDVTQCKLCVSNCDICSTSSLCISCQAGYYLQPTGTTCLTTCPVNYTFDSFNWTCQQCVSSCSSKFKCAQGYFLKGNVCVDTCPSYYIPSLRQCTASCPINFYLNYVNNNCQPCIQGCAYCLTSTYCILWSNNDANPQNQLWQDYLPIWIAIIIAGTIILIVTLYCLIKFCIEMKKKKPQRKQYFSQFNQTVNTGNNLTIEAFQSNKKLKILQTNKQFIQVKQPVIESFGVY